MPKITETLQFVAIAGNASTTAWSRYTGVKLGRNVQVDMYRDSNENRYLVADGCSSQFKTPKKLTENQVEEWENFGPYDSSQELAWAFNLMGFTSCFNS